MGVGANPVTAACVRPQTTAASHVRDARADAERTRRLLRAGLGATRSKTLSIVAALDHDGLHTQVHDFLSPVIWDVGHVGNFEELWLLRTLSNRPPRDQELDDLYDAFEQPRSGRGGLPLLAGDEAVAYLADVRAEVLDLLRTLDLGPDAEPHLAGGYVHRMILQHESQHQETILQSLDLREAVTAFDLSPVRAVPEVDDTDRVAVPGGPFVAGTDDRLWTYDNERSSHVVDVAPFWLDRYPVTTRRFAQFVAAGGYEKPLWWSDRGWQWQQSQGHEYPQGWVQVGLDWFVRRFGRLHRLDPREPVQHVSFFEAEAFATWAGGRLPTEHEWEKAAGWDPRTGKARRFPWGDDPPTTARANVGLVDLQPHPVGSHPSGASAYGVQQLAGDVYEWTTSEFVAWPGFTAFPYPAYSEVFFGGDYKVLRGSSWAIGAPMARVTYRNWDHPYRRQLMAGLRLAWDREDQPGDRDPAGGR